MDYSVVSKIHFNKKTAQKIGAFWYDPLTDGLYHESPWPFPVQLLISHELTQCQVTPGFLKLPFILKGWLNLDILLREIDLIKFAQAGKILMHASCVDDTLIVGFPQAGKTYETYRRMRDGGKLISEEYTLLENASGPVAAPYKPVMRTCFSRKTLRDCRIATSLKEKAWLAATTVRAMLFPFMYEAVIWKEFPVSGQTSTVKEIVYGSTSRKVTDWKEFAILCTNEFPFMGNEFLQAYAVVSGLDLIAIQERLFWLIKDFVYAVYSLPHAA